MRHHLYCTAALAVWLSFSSAVAEPDSRGASEKTVARLGITAPEAVTVHGSVARFLAELTREACDQDAIAKLGAALAQEGYRRDAATAHIRFSETCGGHPPSMRAATNILLKLSDYKAALEAATGLIALEPYRDNGYFLRAIANERLGNYTEALGDYTTAIELYGDKARIASASYEGIARSHDKLGHPCDAAAIIEAWVAANPAQRETTQTRAVIAGYRGKGTCTAAVQKDEVFPVSRPGNVAVLRVAVNGQTGNFILDTGATFVAMKATFANKAKVAVDPRGSVKLSTANGVADAKLGRADSVKLRSLEAQNIAVVVQDDAKAAYGANVDGLLGLSFLSRFKMQFDGKTVRIAKTAS